ncbi:MAG TPA: hypothetical protein PK867_03390 [Pirellulales bacterium]|nr:hypothetical protein [Pirellulales bacterium]
MDVEEWKDHLDSVTAFERDTESLADMLIERDARGYPFAITINPNGVEDILMFLRQEDYSFDLYNLDFYGGFINIGKGAASRTTDALRQVFSEQARAERSFALVCTLNVRDTGAAEYADFLDSAREGLLERGGACAENIRAHDVDQSTRLTLCFPFFCWQQAHANGFEYWCDHVIAYRSSASMIHFFQRFRFKGLRLPPVPHVRTLIEMANRPLYEMHGQVLRKRLVFPQIE